MNNRMRTLCCVALSPAVVHSPLFRWVWGPQPQVRCAAITCPICLAQLPLCHLMQDFYLSLRSSSIGGISGSLPITARQLESLVRLAEARARVELREVVTADDAQVSACGCVDHPSTAVHCWGVCVCA